MCFCKKKLLVIVIVYSNKRTNKLLNLMKVNFELLAFCLRIMLVKNYCYMPQTRSKLLDIARTNLTCFGKAKVEVNDVSWHLKSNDFKYQRSPNIFSRVPDRFA